MELKIKFKNTENFLRAIVNSYRRAIENNEKIKRGYWKDLIESAERHPKILMSLKHNLKGNHNLSNLIKTLFKINKNLSEYYTEEGLAEIILIFIAKKIKNKKSTNLNDTDYKELVKNIEHDIRNMKANKYAFQVLNFKYSGKEIKFGDCTLKTFNGKEKIYPGTFDHLLPRLDSRYRNFILVDIMSNDDKISYREAFQIAINFVNVLKLKFNKSPLVRLGDSYLIPYKDGWFLAYKRSGVLHWDIEIKKANEIREVIRGFEKIYAKSTMSDLYMSLFLSMNRFSYALTIENTSFKIAEIMGCIETLLTTRGEAKIKNPNIQERLTKRIEFILSGRFPVKYKFLEIMIDDYYNDRSDYYHQSSINEIDDKVHDILWLYEEILRTYVKIMDKYKTKKELLVFLDKSNV